METIELTAPTLDDARRLAAEQLGAAPEDITLTVLEEKKGLFGKAGSIKVRAEAKVSKPSKAKEKAPKATAAPAPVAEVEPEPEPEVVEEAAPAKPRGRRKVEKPAVEEAPAAAAEPASSDEEVSSEGPVATQEDADQLIGFLNEIIEAGGLNAEVSLGSLHGKYINLELTGRDVSYLVGKRGEVLNALQYLGNVISSRQLGNGVRVVLDGNNFRKVREDKLTAQAHEIAEQVKANGMEAVLDPLPAFERRLVHQALSEYPGVVTYSEGEEPNRKIVIAPAE